MRWTLAIGFPLLVFLAGCRSAQPRHTTFNEGEYAPYSQPGTGIVTGQAFLKTRGGDVKYGAGNKVLLTPMTSYGEEFFDRSFVKGELLEEGDPREWSFIRSAHADGEGRFRFTKVPAGNYYLTCLITWEVPGQIGTTATGGWAFARVIVVEGKETNAIVTRW